MKIDAYKAQYAFSKSFKCSPLVVGFASEFPIMTQMKKNRLRGEG